MTTRLLKARGNSKESSRSLSQPSLSDLKLELGAKVQRASINRTSFIAEG